MMIDRDLQVEKADGVLLRRVTRALPLVVLVIGLTVTAAAVQFVRSEAEAERLEKAELRAAELTHAIENRVDGYAETLVGVSSFMTVVPDPGRDEFDAFLATSEILARFPGAQAVSFNRKVLPADRATFENSVRGDTTLEAGGYPDFSIHPEGDRSIYCVVDFIVPLAGNEAAFGFDLGGNPARLAAVQAAIDTGEAKATAPIRLVQESADQQGFLLLLAIYQSDGVPDTVDERRESSIGLVSGVFRIGDLMDGVLGPSQATEFEVYDVEAATSGDSVADGLLFDSDETMTGLESALLPGDRPEYTFDVAGRSWAIVVHEAPSIRTQLEGWVFVLIGVGGIILSLALSGMAWTLSRSRSRALALADTMTEKLRNRSGQLERANESLNSYAKRLKASNRDLEEFASVAAHDLQEPLRKVEAFGDRLAMELGSDLSDRARDSLKRMSSATIRMRALIQNLLTYSKVATKSTPFANVDLSTVLALVVEDVHDASAVEVGDLPSIEADEDQMYQLFLNLVSNALKFRSDSQAPEVQVTGQILNGEAVDLPGEWCEIAVSDNGIGFDDDYADRIFGVFQRLNGRNEYEGTGIGLAICRRIVERHGGIIRAQSVVGEGSTLTIRLPVEQRQESS